MSKTKTIFDQLGIHANYHGQAKNRLLARARGPLRAKGSASDLDISELTEAEIAELHAMLREFIGKSKSRALGPHADPEAEPEPKPAPTARYRSGGGLLTAEARFKLEALQRKGVEFMGIVR